MNDEKYKILIEKCKPCHGTGIHNIDGFCWFCNGTGKKKPKESK